MATEQGKSENNLWKSDNVLEYYRSIFDKCDKNKDGSISTDELKCFIRADDEIKIKDQVIINICNLADKNNDGRIDFTEFVELINNPKFGYIFEKYANRYIKFVVVPKLCRRITFTGLYEEQYRCKVHTVNMLIICAIQIILFYIDKNLKAKDATYGPIASQLSYFPCGRSQIWRFITYGFVHADEGHLYPNLLIQLIIGVPLEMVNTWRVLVIYLAGILSGSLTLSVIYPNDLLVGASAGVYSFYTAHIATVIMNWREMTYPSAQLLLFSIITLMDPIYNYVIYQNNETTSYIAHLAGAVAGLLVGVNILRNLRQTKLEGIIWWTFLVIFIVLVVSFTIVNFVITSDCDPEPNVMNPN